MRVLNVKTTMLDSIMSFVAPYSCCSCGELGDILCDICKNDIIDTTYEQCLVCQRPTPDTACSKCLPAGVYGMYCAGERGGALKSLLDAYKFRSSRSAVTHLVDILDNVVPILPTNTVVSVVPTASRHVRQRGFDHTELIGKGLAKKRKVPYRSTLVKTTNDTQHFKSRKDRLKSIGSSISAKASLPESVLLIDDIYTTGATLNACIKELRTAGVKQIYIAVVARQTL